jgi:hypothetical protein
MKNVLFVMALFLGTQAFAQGGIESKKIFVRVYNLKGNKIGKGKILSFSDDAIQLNKGKAPLNILLSDIGSIKTKRSAGHNILIGASAGAAAGIVIALLAADDSNVDDALISSSLATGSGILMGATGAAVGGLTALFKKVETYSIDGDAGKWTSFQTDMGYIE